MRAYIVSIANGYGEIRNVVIKARSRADAAAKAPVEYNEHIECCVELD